MILTRWQRLGGDEFVILLPELSTGAAKHNRWQQDILHLIEKPFQVDQHSLKDYR